MSSIHIKPSKKGTFTAAAKKHGKTVKQFESQVLAHPKDYSPAMRKKAQFSHNARGWKHADDGNQLTDRSGGIDAYAWNNYGENTPTPYPDNGNSDVFQSNGQTYYRIPEDQRIAPQHLPFNVINPSQKKSPDINYGHAALGALSLVDAMIPHEQIKFPVVRPQNTYNPFPKGTGSQALMRHGGAITKGNSQYMTEYAENGAYMDYTEPTMPDGGDIKVTPHMMNDWNNYINYLKSKNLSGNPEMNHIPFSQKTLNDYRKANPQTSLTYDDVAPIQNQIKLYRDYTINKFKTDPTHYNPPSGVDSTYSNFMPWAAKTGVDGINGQYTSQFRFPKEYISTYNPNDSTFSAPKDMGFAKAPMEYGGTMFHYGDMATEGTLGEFGDSAKSGNWLKGAVNPKHKGYCTPMTKSTCTGHRRAFAEMMKKKHGFHKKEDGGEMTPMYEDGGVYDLSKEDVQHLINNGYDIKILSK